MRCAKRRNPDTGRVRCLPHDFFSNCFTRPGCNRRRPFDKPIFFVLPADDPGSDPEFAGPTELINNTLDSLAAANPDPDRELAVIIEDDEDGDSRLAISWVFKE